MTDNNIVTSTTRDQLRAVVEKVERLSEERQSLSSDIREVYSEAKAQGFDTRALRKVVSLRKKDMHECQEEEEALLATYMIALGMVPDAW